MIDRKFEKRYGSKEYKSFREKKKDIHTDICKHSNTKGGRKEDEEIVERREKEEERREKREKRKEKGELRR